MIDKKNYTYLALHLLMIILLALIQIIYPIYVSDMISIQSDVYAVFMIVCSLIIGKLIINLCDTILSGTLYWNIFKELRMKLVSSLVHMDYEDILKRSVGECTQTVENDSTQLIDFYLVLLMTLIKDSLFLVGVIVIAYLKSWAIGLVLTIMIVALFVAFQFINKIAETKWAKTKQAYQELFDTFSTTYLMMNELKGIHKESYLEKKLNQYISSAFHADLLSGLISYQLWISTIFSFGILKFFILLIGCLKGLNLSFIYLFVYYLDLLDDPIYELRTQMENLPSLKKSKERVMHLLDIQSKLHYGNEVLHEKIQEIELSDVCFGYDENLVLNHCSLKLEKGNIYALVGPSGSGKSTMINLISHLYEPQSGTIYINDVALNNYRQNQVMKEMEYVGQNEKDTKNYEEIVNPKNEFSLSTIEEQLGYSLKQELSKGQVQYLYLCRALMSKKSVMILDEVFSSIDMDKIEDAFSRFKQMDKIILVITHEKEIMNLCDSMISMEDL